MDGMSLLTITVLAVFVGFEVVSKVSSTLHTPLMSGANAIHGIILVGAIIVAGQATDPWLLMAQAEAEGQGRKQPKNANEQSQFCNRAGCQYQGRALCAQPFCAEMNYLWSVDRAQRR